MSDLVEETPALQKERLSELGVYIWRTIVRTASIVAVTFCVYLLVDNVVEKIAAQVDRTASQLEVVSRSLKGGPDFWAKVESNLYKFADAPDMPLERKQRIAAALKKIVDKNRPFIDAFGK